MINHLISTLTKATLLRVVFKLLDNGMIQAAVCVTDRKAQAQYRKWTLPFSVHYPSPGEIIRGQLYSHPVSRKYPDVMHAHLA